MSGSVRDKLAAFEEGPLPSMVQQATAEIHKRAERTPLMAAYLRGQLGREGYRRYLSALVPVYEALAATTPNEDPFAHPGLDRRTALLADLDALGGPSGLGPAAAERYAARILEVARTPAWVSHQWLRTLGYLMGQDMLRDLTTRNLGEDAPVGFYTFAEIPDRRSFARLYHQAFDAIATTSDQRMEVIEEAYRAFALQIELTDELAAELGIG
ncbi:MAG: biliverdin-producing heme oxygenase [Actinomycetota bacterium]